MSNDTSPTTMKEALIAELLSDLSIAIDKTNEAVNSASKVETELNASAKALIVAGEKYKGVVKNFTEQAKKDLTGHIEEKTRTSLAPQFGLLRKEIKRSIEICYFDHKKTLSRTHIFIAGSVLINLVLFALLYFK